MKKNIAYSLCAMLLLSACSNDMKDAVDNVPVTQSGLQYMEFTASAGTDTRTQLTSDNKVVWQSDDAISIFDGTGNRKFTTRDSGENAVFGGNAASASTYYALYPYQEGATLSGNVIKNVTLPSEQTAKAGSFDAASNLSVASASSNLQLAFKNVGSLVKFSVSNEQASKVRKVKLTSHDATAVLTGTVDITLENLPAATPISGQQPYATLIADNGLEIGKYYYFAVLPSELNTGFSLTFYDNEGRTWQKDYAADNTTRSKILKLAAIEIGTFTNSLLTNANLIAAAEASTGMTFTKNPDGSVSLLNDDNYQIVMAVTNLDVSGQEDPTICEEIGFFSNLEVLNCFGNGITSLDLTKNTNLTNLDCSSNQLTTLDLTRNTALTYLDCGYNQLESLDLMKNTALTELDCRWNQLTSLDISKNTALTNLNCGGNQLTSLDISNNTALTELLCGANQLTSIDLSKNTALTELDCAYNQLTSLDLSKNIALTGLNCFNNQLTSLDISNNNQLDWTCLYVGGQNNSSGEGLNLYVNAGQLSQTLSWDEYNRNENVNMLLKSDLLLTNANLIAAAEESTGMTFTKNADGSVSLLNDDNYQIAMAVTSLNLGGLRDSSICEEIGVFSNLEVLDCSYNDITKLNLSNNTKLTELYCDLNQLTSLDLSKNTALTRLYCPQNQLTSLDLSKNTALKRLECYDNQLTSLDLTGSTALTYLHCASNQLESLDLMKNTALTELGCSSNQLTSLDISNNTALFVLSCDKNQFTSLDLTKNTALIYLYCSGNQLTSLDLSKNTALREITCYSNQLTSLDISKNTALKRLECYKNQLTSLDLSKNTALTHLDCHSNRMTSLDISNNNKIDWRRLYVGSQTDSSYNDQLLYLYVNADQFSQTLPNTEANNNVNILSKSDTDATGTHENYSETGY